MRVLRAASVGLQLWKEAPHMRNLTSHLRTSISTLFVLGAIFTSSVAYSKHQPKNIDKEIDIDLEEVLSGEVLKKPYALERQTLGFPEENFQNSEKAYRVNAPFNLTVDQYQARAFSRFPIVVAPGANGMTPDLAFKIGSDEGASSGVLTGQPSIFECDSESGLCLRDDQFVSVEDDNSAYDYVLRNDPRVTIKAFPAGFILSDGRDFSQVFQSVESKDGSKYYRLRLTSDWYENHIFYDYDQITGDLASIRYGQDKVMESNLRTVHFRYNQSQVGMLEQIESRVGTDVVRLYNIHRNAQNQVISLQECTVRSAKKTQLSCYSPTEFKWVPTENGLENLLSAVHNGAGAKTEIRYTNRDGYPIIQSMVLFEGQTKMGETQFSFTEPLIKDEKIIGFGKSWSHSFDQPMGEFRQYAAGNDAGLLLAEGMFRADKALDLAAHDYPLISKTEYIRGPNIKATDAVSVVTQKIDVTFDENGSVESQLETDYQYDQKHRIKRVASAENVEEYTYLDERDQSYSNNHLGSLVVEKSNFDRRSNENISRKIWTYEFDEYRLVKSRVQVARNGELIPELSTTHILDEHGNTLKTVTSAKTTEFTYDQEYKSFPVTASVTVGEKVNSIVWNYDVATGKQVLERFEDGTQIQTKLNLFGEVGSVSSILKDPRPNTEENDINDVFLISETTRITDLGGGRIRQTKMVDKSSSPDNEAEILRIETDTDALGRVIKISGEARDNRGLLLRSSSLLTEYNLAGQLTTITDEAGSVQKSSFDQLGRLIFEETDGYGATEFRYDENNLVSEVTKNGQSISHKYDLMGRLVTKTMPDGRLYAYEYSDDFKSKLSRVTLPSHKTIDFEYSDRGQISEKKVEIPDGNGQRFEFKTSFEYENDQLSEVHYPDGSIVTYQYDGTRLVDIQWGAKRPRNWQDKDVSIAEYNAKVSDTGEVVLTKTLGNGIVEDYQWTENGRLQSIGFKRHVAEAETTLPVTYFSYDFKEETDLISHENRTDFYRNAEQLTIRSHMYDEDLKLHDSLDRSNENGRSTYELSDLNERLDAADLKFDENLNVTEFKTKSRKVSLNFDAENRLNASTILKDGKSRHFTYEYDHLGERIEKREEGGSVTYYINEFYEFTVHSDGTMQETRYVWDHMGRIAAFTDLVSDDDFLASVLIPAVASPPMADTWIASGLGLFSQFSDTLTMALSIVAKNGVAILSLSLAVVFSSLWAFHMITSEKTGAVARAPLIKIGLFKRSALLLTTIVFSTVTMAPSVHAALEGGDGSPKIDHVTYFHHDIRGSVISVSDLKGNQSASVGYSPYGNMAGGNSTAGNNNFRFKFAGMEFDEETQLYYDVARYYSPELARFLSPDPARSTQDPYAYTENDPVNFIDPDGRMIMGLPLAAMHRNVGVQAVPTEPAMPAVQPVEDDENSSWFRYPTFWNWTFKKTREFEPPVDDEGPHAEPTDEDRSAYDRLARSGYMQGLTRMGGYLQSVFGAALLAWLAPTSYEFNDGTMATAGFGVDLAVYFMTVTAFSAYGKGYTANESQHWNGIKAKGAKSADYARLAARRLLWKIGVQITAFTGIKLLASLASGYPVLGEDSSTNEALTTLGLLVARYLVYSIGGNTVLLPYYLMTKEPKEGYDDRMEQERLAAMPWWKRWVVKASISYRSYTARKGFWAEQSTPGTWKRFKQNLWYPSYIVQMYGLYMLSSLGYYGGLAAIMPGLPNLDANGFFTAWRRNLILIILSPASSPLTVFNYWRKSFTIVKKRSHQNPRTSGFLFRVLGPIEGLRIGRYEDRAYLPPETWMKTLRDSQVVPDLEEAVELPALEIDDGDDPFPGPEFDGDVGSQGPSERKNAEPDDDDGADIIAP